MKYLILIGLMGLLANCTHLSSTPSTAHLHKTSKRTPASLRNHSNREILICSVTEPFYTYTYYPDMGALTRTGAEISPAEEIVSRNASFQVVGSEKRDLVGSKYKIVDTKTGKTFIEATLNLKGSDGMSDRTYPFSAKIDSWYGGCESTSAPAMHIMHAVDALKSK